MLSCANGFEFDVWVLTKHKKFVYHNYKLILELDLLANTSKKFVWLGDNLLSFHEGNNSYQYVADGNKNITQLISSTTGAIINKYEYNPFGALAVNDETVDNPFKFSSEYNEKETGLVYYNYRFYDPSTGKWLSRDPIEEDGGENIYSFTLNNSINYWDYLGFKRVCQWRNAGSVSKPKHSSPKARSKNERWIKIGVDGFNPRYNKWRREELRCYDTPVVESEKRILNCSVIVWIGHNHYVEEIHDYNIPKCSRVGTLGCFSGDMAQPPKNNKIPGFPEPKGLIGWSKKGRATNGGKKSMEELVEVSMGYAKDEADLMSQDCKCDCKEITLFVKCQTVKESPIEKSGKRDGYVRRVNKTFEKICNKVYKIYPCQKNKKK